MPMIPLGSRPFQMFKPFNRFPRYAASDGRYSGWPDVLSGRQRRRIEGRSVQAVEINQALLGDHVAGIFKLANA